MESNGQLLVKHLTGNRRSNVARRFDISNIKIKIKIVECQCC